MSDAPSSLHKGLRAFKALRGHTLTGLSNQQLTKATGLSPTAITRVMQALMDEGLAERGEDGRFRLSMATVQIATAHAQEMAAMRDRMDEINRRIAIGANR